MVHKVLVDEQALGWGEDNQDLIHQKYEKIFFVGTKPAPPKGSNDKEIGTFCEEQGCNLITSDYTAYTHFLENPRINAVQIEKFQYNSKASRQIYLIRIL
ncbi:hypothetical protein [Nitrosopumilus maritimus]|uniref:DUF5615 domain-containing protein n=1 Tax=Nitrosopumilus maritimus (strain SCM1) TaxID=436308 RepID=A9A3H7_NITMS|nr:hypothetical protein [Nitrosopumilus maritimus]ABX12909.1 hypothetical protein Nmar_1013 [Nitrosopumilus maritimus SCM1]